MMAGKERYDANYGGKIFLPPSALNKLSMLHISYPMLFQIHSEENSNITYAGVLEFIAEEGRVYLPQWIIENLEVGPGSLIEITSADIPTGSFVKIEPQSVDFLEISDPKAVLERTLRNFSTLTVGDIFKISYNNHIYAIKVLEVKPDFEDHHSICCVETDLEVDFAPPVGYIDPSIHSDSTNARGSKNSGSQERSTSIHDPLIGMGTMAQSIRYLDLVHQTLKSNSTNKFIGSGQKLSGKPIINNVKSVDMNHHYKDLVGLENPHINPLPLQQSFGQLFFGYPIISAKTDEESENNQHSNNDNKTFLGLGQSLRESRKRKEHISHATKPTKKNLSPDIINID